MSVAGVRRACVLVVGLVVCGLSGSAVEAQERDAGTRYAIAIERGDVQAVEALIAEGHGPETVIMYGDRAMPVLCKAAWEGQTEIAQILLDAGADVNAADPDGTTALMSAITRQWDDLVELLLDAEADPNLENTYKQTALQGAIGADRVDLLELLLEHGAELRANAYGHTPLMTAVASEALETIDFLLDHGADVNEMTSNGTALIMGIYTDKVDAVRALLDRGADPELGTDSGTPLEIARQYEKDEIAAMLEDAIAKGGTP